MFSRLRFFLDFDFSLCSQKFNMLEICDENIHKTIADLCLKHFDSLPKSGKPQKNEWTVLSCIVKEQENEFHVVALGTGTKCVGKNKLCLKGTILNDSHAEVICRRAFLSYLCNELKNESSIFNLREQSKFILKLNVKFHFFTTHVPCGDAAIFSKQSIEEFGDIVGLERINPDNIPSKKRKIEIEQDIYRTGAKCLSYSSKQDLKEKGEQYHILGVVRTKPGRGDPTISVSCSDKISKWCHMGIQGTLLTKFIEHPIFLSTFTIVQNTPFCKLALKRALYDRLEILDLKPPFGQRCMCIKQVDLSFAYCKTNEKQPCPSSIYWFSVGKHSCSEVAVNGKKQGVTKKHLDTEKARLQICKLEFFHVFIKKLDQYNIKLYENIENINLSYKMAKKSCKYYKLNWESLKQSFGNWSLKDDSLFDFKL